MKKRVSLGVISILLLGGCAETTSVAEPMLVDDIQFLDVSDVVGLKTESVMKYSGPSINDFNNDGYYDFLLTNHNTTPVQLFESKIASDKSLKYQLRMDLFELVDLHGVASGDYDQDGDSDILLSVGGGNGLKPQPQRLLRNDNGTFVDVTVEAGLSKMGARGRSVRWVDIDNDGDLDFMQVNAPKVINEQAPRNILFENLGDGTFRYAPSPIFEEIDAERLLLTDFNGDQVMDVFAFDAYSETTIWKGNGDFTFENVTEAVLPGDIEEYKATQTVAHADIDNDGDLDYYFSRGMHYYTLANNSVDLDETSKRLDLRDEGNKSHDGMDLYASGDITLTDFFHWPKAKLLDHMPLFLGKDKKQIATPYEATVITQQAAAGFPNSEAVTETGWYLGYVGDGKWRFEWKLVDNLAWGLRASLIGIDKFESAWEPQTKIIKDVLLRNDNGKFTDISEQLPDETHFNNWGVITGDFNNDGREDFFVHRFGKLKQRIEDVLLLNTGNNFVAKTGIGATTELGNDSHGDMGAAFDYNLDGRIDMLNGDDDMGKWHLYENVSESLGNYVLLHIGYSKNGVDPYGAVVKVTSKTGSSMKLIGSNSEAHSQSLLNIAHFGLGDATSIKSIDVRWRDGTSRKINNIKANQLVKIGEF